MKIAIFTNNYLPNPYGVAGSIESFRKEFEKLGHTVYIFAPKFKSYKDTNPNVFRYPSINFTFKNINFPIAIPFSFKMNKILKDLEIDIIHSQHPNLLGWQAKKWAKKKNISLVFTWHTLYDKYAHFSIFPEKISAWWAIKNAVNYANSAEYVITPTPSVIEIIKNWGVSNENITAIATGINENDFKNIERAEARCEFEISDDEIVISFVGRLTAEKNVIFLAKIAREILKKNPKTIFMLAGGGSELEKVKKELEIFGNRFRYAGVVQDEEKEKIYMASDIFVYASKSETQGMVISEAMYSGIPIVAIDAPGVCDLVQNNQTGFLVEENEKEFFQAVQKLIDDKNLRMMFSENAKLVARENYTSQISATKMLEVYQSLL